MWRGPSAARSSGRKAFTVFAVPTTLTESSHCQSSAVICSSGPNCMTPTLAATTLQLPKLVGDGSGRGVERGPVGHVDPAAEGRGAGGREAVRDRFGRFAVDVEGGDPHALGGEGVDHRLAEAGTGAGDDRGAARERAHRARKSAGPPSSDLAEDAEVDAEPVGDLAHDVDVLAHVVAGRVDQCRRSTPCRR